MNTIRVLRSSLGQAGIQTASSKVRRKALHDGRSVGQLDDVHNALDAQQVGIRFLQRAVQNRFSVRIAMGASRTMQNDFMW